MRQTALFAGVLLMGASAFAADSQLMNLAMPDAQIMAGINVTTAQISPFGQYVLARITGTGAGLQSFTALTGFDPTKDVTEILAASNGNTAAPSGLVLARGAFNVAQLAAAASKDKNANVTTYGGATLISGGQPKAGQTVAFLGTSIAIAGDAASVKSAIDRSGGVNSVSPQLASRVQTLSTTEDAWSVSLASVGSLLPAIGGAPQGAGASTIGLMKNIQASSGGVKFGQTVDVIGQAVADTPQNAAALADIIRMIGSLAAMGAGKDPGGAAAAQLLQKLSVTTDGTAVNITASIPEADLETLLKTVSADGAALTAKPSAKPRRL